MALKKDILEAQAEREYKIALEHIQVAKKRDKGEVYIKMAESVGDLVRAKLEADGYSTVTVSNGLTQVLWVDVEFRVSLDELRVRAAAKLTPEERDAVGINKDGTYQFSVAKHKVVLVTQDAWSGPQDGRVELFYTKDQAMAFIKEYNEEHNPHMGKPGVRTPNEYTKPEYRGVVTD